MTHWAAKYIGLAWSPERNCWWLVRQVFRDRYGIEMPELGVGDIRVADNVASIKQAAEVSGWRRAEGDPQDGDILLGRDFLGKRHVGVMIETRGKLRFLHNDGYTTEKGCTGSVLCQPLADVTGFTEIEIWRRV